MPWYLIALPVLCGAIAVLELDAVHVGQWMLARPIVLGPLLGTVCGAPALGIAGGGLIELFCVDVLPIGADLPVNGAVAVSAFLLLAAGPEAVPAALAFPAGLLLGSLFRRVEVRVRTARDGYSYAAEEAAFRQGTPPFRRLLAQSLGMHLAATAVFLYLAVTVAGPALSWAWAAAPYKAKRGFELAYANAPWLGLAALLHSLRPKR